MLLRFGARVSTNLPVWDRASTIPPDVELELLALSTLWFLWIEDWTTAMVASDPVATST